MCYNVQFKKHFLGWMLLRFLGASSKCLFNGVLVKRQVLVRRPGGRPEKLTFWQAPRPCWGCCSVNPRWGAGPQTPVFWIQFSKLKSCGVEHCPPSTLLRFYLVILPRFKFGNTVVCLLLHMSKTKPLPYRNLFGTREMTGPQGTPASSGVWLEPWECE